MENAAAQPTQHTLELTFEEFQELKEHFNQMAELVNQL